MDSQWFKSRAHGKHFTHMVAQHGSSEAMCAVPATVVCGAGDLQGLVSQLNLWTPQIEPTEEELRGAQLVMCGSNAAPHRECGSRVLERGRHRGGGEDTVCARAQASQGCRGSAVTIERQSRREEDTDPVRWSTDSSVTRHRNATQVQRGPETFGATTGSWIWM